MPTEACHRVCSGCRCSTQGAVFRPLERCATAVVFDFPTELELKRDEWLASRRKGARAVFQAALEALGVDPDDVYFCSAVNCRPNPRKKALLRHAMIACRQRLLRELQDAGVERVLSVGPLAYSMLAGEPSLLAITGVRGRWMPVKKVLNEDRRGFSVEDVPDMQVMATYDPSFAMRDPLYFRDIAWDLKKFFSTNGRMPDPDVRIWVPETIAEAKEAHSFLRSAGTIASDVETTGLSPIAESVLAMGFAILDDDDGESATVVIFDEDLLSKKTTWRLVADLLNDEDIELVYHNAKFDLQHIKDNLLERGLPYEPRNIHDTMMLHYTLDERPIGKYKSHSLEQLARVRYDAPDYGIGVKRWLEEWAVATPYDRRRMRHELHLYLALDCYYTARLFPDLWNEALAEDEALLDLYDDLLMPATLALADIEYHGILIDRQFYQQARLDLQARLDAMLRRIKEQLHALNVSPSLADTFNPGSPKQVRELIYDEFRLPFGLTVDKDGKVYHTARRGGLQEGPTAAPVLKSLAYRFPEYKDIIDDICEYRNLAKNMGTYVVGLLERVDVDSRMRTSFNLCGTATGRLSSSNPNLQNIPDASHTGVEIRAGFIPPEGHVLIEADYKQLEVRIAAWLSGDDVMRAVFESGRDPHQEIAFSIYNKPKEEVTHYMRWLAKNILFGLLYGRGYESVATGPEQEDIAARGGRRWGLEEVKGFYDNLLAQWRRFAAWQKAQKEMGYRDGVIKMPTGRRRRFDFIPPNDAGYVGRASFNNPIQGTASDFTLDALIKLHARLPEGAHIVLTVHDAIIIECRKDLVDEVTDLIREVMERDTLFDIDVPLLADVEVEERWGVKEFAKQHMTLEEIEAMEAQAREAADV